MNLFEMFNCEMSFRVKSNCLRAVGYYVAASRLLPVPWFFLHSWHFPESNCSWLGERLCSNIRQPLLLFRTNVPAVMPTTSNFVYFSFLPMKQRDFPGNVRSGGCDSLPLVVAFTSKQHESPLSYALHFLRIISHQMCCAGERVEGLRAPVRGEISPHA